MREEVLTFKNNFPDATVFLGDCNKILKELMDAESEERTPKWQGKNLPLKEEVEIIICGNNFALTFSTLFGYHTKCSYCYRSSVPRILRNESIQRKCRF